MGARDAGAAGEPESPTSETEDDASRSIGCRGQAVA